MPFRGRTSKAEHATNAPGLHHIEALGSPNVEHAQHTPTRLHERLDAIVGSGLSTSARFVLVILAMHADKNDGSSFPGVQRIATQTGMSDRGVRKVLRRLEELGAIVTERREGRSSLYRPAWSAFPTPEPRSPRNDVPPHPGTTFPPPRNDVPPTPEPRSPEPTQEPTQEPIQVEPTQVATEVALVPVVEAAPVKPTGKEAWIATAWELCRRVNPRLRASPSKTFRSAVGGKGGAASEHTPAELGLVFEWTRWSDHDRACFLRKKGLATPTTVARHLSEYLLLVEDGAACSSSADESRSAGMDSGAGLGEFFQAPQKPDVIDVECEVIA